MLFFALGSLFFLTNLRGGDSSAVRASDGDKINIYPGRYDIEKNGANMPDWQNATGSFGQDLADMADLSAFNRENSAYISLGYIAEPQTETVASGTETVIHEDSSSELLPVPIFNEALEKQESASETLVVPGGQCFAPSPEQLIEINNTSNINSELNQEVESVITPVLELTPELSPELDSEPASGPVVEPVSEPVIESSPAVDSVPSPSSDSDSGGDVSLLNRFFESAKGLFAYFSSGSFAKSETVKANEELETTAPDLVASSTPLVSEPVFEKQSLIYSDFSIPGDYEEADISNIQLRLSMSAMSNKQKDALVFEYRIGAKAEWALLNDFLINNAISNANNGGYFLIGMPVFERWSDINNLQIRISYKSEVKAIVDQQTSIYIDALWLEIDSSLSGKDFKTEVEDAELKALKEQFSLEFLSDKSVFKIGENPKFKFKFKKKRSLLDGIGAGLKSLLSDEYENIEIIARLMRGDEEVRSFDLTAQYLSNGEFEIDLGKQPREFRPGEYRLEIEIKENSLTLGRFLDFTKDFSWGVLAFNSNKSIYSPNEKAYLQMGVVNDLGHTLCDADLVLEITAPDGSVTVQKTEVSENAIVRNPECGPDNVITTPDYYSYYAVGGTGVYDVRLIANTDNGQKEIHDQFEVRDYVPFDIDRTGPTRVYPYAGYEVTFTIKANEDYQGDFIEKMPTSFKVVYVEGAVETINGEDLELKWAVDWKKGESYFYRYILDPPNISPEFFLLGPITFSNNAFAEIRSWQIASDADIGYVLAQSIALDAGSADTVNYTTAVSAASGAFIGGKKYFVYVTGGFAGSGTTVNSDFEIRYDTTTQYTGLVEAPGSAGDDFQISWMDVYDQPSTPTSIDLRYRPNSGTTNSLHAQILAINLSDLRPTDWSYSTHSTAATHTTTYTDKASTTLTYANGVKDWLIFGMADVAVNDSNGGTSYSGQIYNGIAGYMRYIMEGENNAEQLPYVLIAPFVDVATNTTFSMRVADVGAAANTYTGSKIFALNMDAFESHKSMYTGTDVNFGATPTYTSIGNLNAGSNYQPISTGNQIIFSSWINNAGSATAGTNDRLRVNGITAPVSWDWTQGAALDKTGHGVADFSLFNITAVTSIPTTGYTISTEATEMVSNTQVMDEISMAVFSTALAPNILPTGIFNSANQATSAPNAVGISIDVNDQNFDPVMVRIEYATGTTCSFATPGDPTLDEATTTIVADFGEVRIDNSQTYQVGTSTYKIITTSGANTVSFDWNPTLDIPGQEGDYCLRLTANDGYSDQTTPATTTVYVDNKAPTGLGALTEYAKDDTSVTLRFGAQASDANFYRYRIFYKEGISGVTESDMELIDDNLNYINYNGFTTTVVSDLVSGTDYVFNIWAYDSFGHSISSVENNIKTEIGYNPPTGIFNSAAQKTDGSGIIDLSIEINDADRDNVRAKLEYQSGLSCSFAPASDPTLDETDGNITADFGDPIIDNSSVYQIGTGTDWIVTASGSNSVLFDWNSVADIPTADGDYCLRLTANDGTQDQSVAATTTITIDNTAPTTPGYLSLVSDEWGNITLSLGTSTTESNFTEYKIFYKIGTSGVTEGDTAFTQADDANLGAIDFNGATTTVISGLISQTQYVFNIWAYDAYGHKVSAMQELTLMTNKVVTTDAQYWVTPNSGTNLGVDTTDTVCGTLYTTIPKKSLLVGSPSTCGLRTRNRYTATAAGTYLMSFSVFNTNYAKDTYISGTTTPAALSVLQNTAGTVSWYYELCEYDPTGSVMNCNSLGTSTSVTAPDIALVTLYPSLQNLTGGIIHAGNKLALKTWLVDPRASGWTSNTFYLDTTRANEESYIRVKESLIYVAPEAADSLQQYRSDGVTAIANGTLYDENNIVLGAAVNDADTSDTLTLYFQVATTSGVFDISTGVPSGSCVSGTAYGSCASKIWSRVSALGNYSATPFMGTTSIASIPDSADGYKWQVKACDSQSSCSMWVNFNDTIPNFTIDTKPRNVTIIGQYKNDGTTVIGNGGWTNEDNVKLKASANDPDATSALNIYFELVGNASAFTSATSSACASTTAWASCASKVWVATSSVADYRITPFIGEVNPSGLPESSIGYKWQMTTCDNDNTCSSWFDPGSDPNFRTDLTIPVAPGALTVNGVSVTDVFLNLGTPGSDANFASYKIYYKVGSSGVSETDDLFTESSFSMIDFGGATSTMISNLAAGTQYVFNMWIYDQAGNRASATPEVSTTTINSVTAPSGSIFSVSQKGDGSGAVDFVIRVDDPDNDNILRAKIMYNAGSVCTFGASSDPTIDMTDENTTATYGDPKVDNNMEYQIGSSTGWIMTSPGENFVLFDWLSKNEAVAANGTYCVGMVVSDGVFVTATSTQLFILDNVNPISPGALTMNKKSATSVTVNFGSVSSDSNFRDYRIYYSTSTPPTMASSSEFFEANMDFVNYNGAATTTITGLDPNTQYYFNIWAFDNAGNNASSSAVLNVKTNALPNNVLAINQYENTSGDAIANGGWSNDTNMLFRASANDPDTSELLTLYFQLATNAGSLSTATTTPTGACVWGTAYNSCASKIWFVSSSTASDYSVTPFAATTSITGIPQDYTGYKWQALACDDDGDCSVNWTVFNATQPNFKVDLTNPVAPGSLVEFSKTQGSITLNFGAVGSDANFAYYKIFYATSSPVSESSLPHLDGNLSYVNYNNATTTTVNYLSSGTSYYFNIWIYDQAGNKASSTMVVVTTNSGGTPVSKQYWLIPNTGTNLGADTTNINCGTSMSTFSTTISLLSATDSVCNTRTRFRATPSANGVYQVFFSVFNTAYTVDTYISGSATSSAIKALDPSTTDYLYYQFCEYDPLGTPQNCTSLGTSTSVSVPTAVATLNPVTTGMMGGYIHAGKKLGVKLMLSDYSGAAWGQLETYLDENFTPGIAYVNITETPDATPSNPANLVQYKSDATTAIANGAWVNDSTIVLKASANDPSVSDNITLYFEATSTTANFTTITTQPSSSCAAGTAWNSCASKIWRSASLTGDYRVTPYTGTTTVSAITPDGSYKWQVIACDATTFCSSWVDFNPTVPNFKIDVTSPTPPGALTIVSKDSRSVTLQFGASTTEANFSQYKIYYKIGSTGVTESDLLWASSSDPDLGFQNYNYTATTTITGLSSSTQYVFNIWAYDQAGNKASSTLQVSTTTDQSYIITQRSFLLENDDGANVNSNTAEVAASTSLANLNIGERLNARIQIDNTGGDTTGNKIYKLQYENVTDSPGTWSDVGAATQIAYSLGLSGVNGDIASTSKAVASGYSWMNGAWYENTNLSGGFDLGQNKYTELIFAIKNDAALAGKTYRLRLYNSTDNVPLTAYANYPIFTTVATETKAYSKVTAAALPSSKAGLDYYLDPQGYADTTGNDSVHDSVTSFAQYAIYNFATKNTNNTNAITATWNGQSSLSPLFGNVVLQVYRFGSVNNWVTVSTESMAAADTDFDISGSVNALLSEYYDINYWTFWRVYQVSGTQTLRTDTFGTSFTVPTPTVSQNHYRWRNDDGSESTATWKEAEDIGSPTTGPALAIGSSTRIRIATANITAGTATNYQYRLEYAPTASNCETDPGGWITVPATTATTEHFAMATSSYFADGDSTITRLANAEGYATTSGKMVENPSNTTGSISLVENQYVENEYMIKATSNALMGNTYCFRVTNAGTALNSYTIFPELTIAGISNNIPTFTVNPVDNGSATDTPTSYGTSVTFAATAEDLDGDSYYLAICKTNSITPGNGAAPTCNGGSWCVSGLASSSVETDCSYTVATSTESNAWYGFVCDYRLGVGSAKCSPSSQGGWGSEDDSPFVVNNPPAFSAVVTTNNNQNPGSNFTITTTSSDNDVLGGADKLTLYVCTVNSADYNGCTVATSTLCSAVATSSPNAKCYYQDVAPSPSGPTTYYAFVFDSHNLAATTNSRSNSYSINNVAPTVGPLVLNSGIDITLLMKGTDTTVQAVNSTVTDANGCQSLVSATAVAYMSNATGGYNCAANNNDCYLIGTSNCVVTECIDANDSTAKYTCTANLKYYAIPTDDPPGTPSNPNRNYNWLSRINVYDGATYVATTSIGVEVLTTTALNVNEAAINFGNQLYAGDNTGAANATTTVENYGNSPIDARLSGTDMSANPSGTIPVNNIEWSINNFTWSVGADLSTTGTNANLGIPKPTSATTESKNVYWGIGIPWGTDANLFTGTNSFQVELYSAGW